MHDSEEDAYAFVGKILSDFITKDEMKI